ncbi:MAG TPA: phospholipid scramblase-related protein [Bacteriovoracaceae bacterium]|nr:phospholipid scramblase-related protein [Bacteriovoracaceae bacterium]
MSTHQDQFEQHLLSSRKLHVQQVWEGFEIVLGWESRNKYRILDDDLRPVAFAAEQSQGFVSSILRQFLGHWRSFRIAIFDENRQKIYDLDFPFRWFFKTLILRDMDGRQLGHLQEKWAFFRKKFDVYDKHGKIIARINSSFFKFWTFEFTSAGQSLGVIQKKWAGVLGEFFTDKDNFIVSFNDPNLGAETRAMMLATCLMVDIIYFEDNQGKKGVLNLFD